jgi:DNA modification methylase
VAIHHGSIEAFACPSDAFDFALTSPPYWKRERYDAEENRSYEDWCQGFLTCLATKSYVALKRGAYFVLNVSDYQDHGLTVPLVADAQRIFTEAGFSWVAEYRMEKHPSSSSREYEPMLVFRKP